VIFLLYFKAKRDLIISNVRDQKLFTQEENTTINRTATPYYVMKNYRQNFRVPLTGTQCSIEFLDFEEKRLNKLRHKKVDGNIENISLGGMKFSCNIDLPVKTSISINSSFNLKNEEFSLNGEIIRKEEYTKTRLFCYGVQFDELSSEDEKVLSKTLNNLIIEREKK
jgi:c-di-GMP-binding flagellar brake protein YcgR